MSRYSIILPVRNGGEYVKECVASILGQTLGDFNLHILDNCSSDGTTGWLRSLNDQRIVLIEATEPLSIEKNWARIVNIQKNEFITLIGHDDVLDPHYLEEMSALMSRYPDARLYQTHFRLIDSSGAEIRKSKSMAEWETAAAFLSAVLQGKFDLFGTGFMMRSGDYDALGGLPDYPNLLFADFELWMKLTRMSYKATSLRECFAYRVHQSTTQRSPDAKMHKAFERFIHFLKSLKESDYQLKAVIDQEAPQFLVSYCKGLSHRLLRSPLSEREGLTVNRFIDNCKTYANVLDLGRHFDPASDKTIQIARLIDSTFITRQLFLWFKKFYSKPVLK
jgi:glycosyltransferase involved in cell wall biosynthesis